MQGQHGAHLRHKQRAEYVVAAEVYQVYDRRQLFSSRGWQEVRNHEPRTAGIFFFIILKGATHVLKQWSSGP